MTRFQSPKDWRRVPLHEVAEIRTGIAKGKTGLKDPVDLPYLRVANVQDGHIDLTEVKRISVEHDQVERYSLRAGDILMTEGGDFDKLGRGDVWLGQIEPCLHQNHVFAVRPQAKQIDPFYLAALAASNYGREYFLGCAKRSTNLASINSSQLKTFPVLLPTLVEQRRIARVLSTWDQAIATADRLLANSRRQKQAFMNRLLLQRTQRNEWPFVSIGEICERIHRRRSEDTAELPVLMISSGSGFVRQDEKYGRFMAGKSVENYVSLKKGEFAYNKGNSKLYEFGCVFPLENYAEGLVPHVYMCFKLNTHCNVAFYQHLFAADYLHNQLGALVNTGVRNNGLLNIRPHSFFGCKVPLPPMEEQVRVAAVLATATQWIARHESLLEALKQEKAALMAQLLTGKRRVRLIEPESETEV